VLTSADLLIGAAIVAVPLLMIYKQPDLGTAATIVPALVAVAFIAGLPMRIFGILALVGVLAAPAAWMFALKDYQRERISTFLDPEKDARGAGYQQIQARITTGSGGLSGKGFGKGTQAQHGFLPEAQNDFIFSSIGEEIFFRGALMPVVGLVVSSAVFALLHIGPKLRYLPWTLSSFVAGLMFGQLFLWSGDLTGAVVAHFIVNFLNLRHLSQHELR